MMRLFAVVLCLIFQSFSFKAYAGEGHDAGYEWGQLQDIRDVDYDNGNSESFNEGVREYAEEMAELEEEEEGDEY